MIALVERLPGQAGVERPDIVERGARAIDALAEIIAGDRDPQICFSLTQVAATCPAQEGMNGMLSP